MSSDGKSLDSKAVSIRDVVKRINEPQALSMNLQHLEDAGGVEALLKLLETDPERGIEETSIQKRRDSFGSNNTVTKNPQV